MKTYQVILATAYDSQAVEFTIETTDKATARRVVRGFIKENTYHICSVKELG